ncbi:unnamed protein product [Prunus armeniaca]
MRAEVDKLCSIGFIKEVDYPTWLANVVMVRKPKKGWRMCVDYTNLNQAYPALTSLLTPRLATPSLASWVLTLNHGLYCYKVMPFRLKNVGATYQGLVNSLFVPLIGSTMEAYVDDMLVKSRTADQHISNLYAMFTILKQYRIRLNPEKCAFGVASEKFFGFMII